MSYVRVSMMRPLPGREHQVRQTLTDLVAFYRQQPGYLSGYMLEHEDGLQQFGRIGIWDSKEAAERAARLDHDLALRAALNDAVLPDSHEEYAFDGTLSGPEPSA